MSQNMLSSMRTFWEVLVWTHFQKFLTYIMAFTQSFSYPFGIRNSRFGLRKGWFGVWNVCFGFVVAVSDSETSMSDSKPAVSESETMVSDSRLHIARAMCHDVFKHLVPYITRHLDCILPSVWRRAAKTLLFEPQMLLRMSNIHLKDLFNHSNESPNTFHSSWMAK